MDPAHGVGRLVGRRLANAQLGETLLPKRIALPVFASDALSSVAYAPDEILITLSLAGMAGFMFSWQVGLAVGGAHHVILPELFAQSLSHVTIMTLPSKR